MVPDFLSTVNIYNSYNDALAFFPRVNFRSTRVLLSICEEIEKVVKFYRIIGATNQEKVERSSYNSMMFYEKVVDHHSDSMLLIELNRMHTCAIRQSSLSPT